MTHIKCLVVDDEPVAIRIIERYLDELSGYEVVASCTNALAAQQVLDRQEVDLMFLDLEMPKLKGLSFLKTLRHPPAVIITTAHREFALEGFELDVLDYLLKPITFERFMVSINRFKRMRAPLQMSLASSSNSTFLYVRSDRKMIKIPFEKITFIEGMSNYVKIHSTDTRYTVYSSLKEMMDNLTPSFIRVHKSYIVNRDQVQSFTNELIDIGGKELPIGQTYRTCLDHL